jgi:hypothetical protein
MSPIGLWDSILGGMCGPVPFEMDEGFEEVLGGGAGGGELHALLRLVRSFPFGVVKT